METFSALLTLCAMNSPVSPVNSPHKGQCRGALIFFFDLRLNKRLSKQSWGWWFETPLSSLSRRCNALYNYFMSSCNEQGSFDDISTFFWQICSFVLDFSGADMEHRWMSALALFTLMTGLAMEERCVRLGLPSIPQNISKSVKILIIKYNDIRTVRRLYFGNLFLLKTLDLFWKKYRICTRRTIQHIRSFRASQTCLESISMYSLVMPVILWNILGINASMIGINMSQFQKIQTY